MLPTGPEYAQLPRNPETWIIQDLLPVSGRANLFGPPKKGKSFLALQLAAAVSTSDPSFLSFPIHLHGPVVYLQFDTPRSLWADRIQLLTHSGGLNFDAVYFMDRILCPFSPFNILVPAHALWLSHELAAVSPVLLIIDTWREIFRGSENDSDVSQMALSQLTTAAAPAALLIISHPKKRGEFPTSLTDENRGSSYLSGAMDAYYRLTPKRLTYESRSAAEDAIPLTRTEVGLWVPDLDKTRAIVERFLSDPQFPTELARAEALSTALGRSVEASRSLLRRLRYARRGFL